MGARTVWEIRTYSDRPSIYLYSHWGGDTKWIDTVQALEQARFRWDDPSYGARIFISQIVGSQWDLETGFGITAGDSGEVPFEESYFNAVIDFSSKTVTLGEHLYTFEEFVSADDITEQLGNEFWEVSA
jgi:hypothetical protein